MYVPFVNHPFESWSCLTNFSLILYIVTRCRARLLCSLLLKFNKNKDLENALWYLNSHIDSQKKNYIRTHIHASIRISFT